MVMDNRKTGKRSVSRAINDKRIELLDRFQGAVAQGLIDPKTLDRMAATAFKIENSVTPSQNPGPQAPSADTGVFYSGPARGIRQKFGGLIKRNRDRSKQMAQALHARHIEDVSVVANSIFGKDSWFRLKSLFFAFAERFSALKILIGVPRNLIAGYFSRRYASEPFRHVVTAVCGADHSRTFFQQEFPTLLKNDRVLTINDIDMDAVRRISRTVSLDAAFNLVCLGELRKAYEKEKASQAGAAKTSDYYERLLSYVEERQTVPPLSHAESRWQRKIAAEYNIGL